MQRVEDDVGRDVDQPRGQVGARVDLDHLVSFASRSAAAHSRPDDSDTSRSAEGPPISTATLGDVLLDMPATCASLGRSRPLFSVP